MTTWRIVSVTGAFIGESAFFSPFYRLFNISTRWYNSKRPPKSENIRKVACEPTHFWGSLSKLYQRVLSKTIPMRASFGNWDFLSKYLKAANWRHFSNSGWRSHTSIKSFLSFFKTLPTFIGPSTLDWTETGRLYFDENFPFGDFWYLGCISITHSLPSCRSEMLIVSPFRPYGPF